MYESPWFCARVLFLVVAQSNNMFLLIGAAASNSSHAKIANAAIAESQVTDRAWFAIEKYTTRTT
jgi:hypothetical protein